MNTKNSVIGCLVAIIVIILLGAILIITSFGLLLFYNSKPLNLQPNIQPKVDIHMPPTSVHVHPRQSAFKCTNCGAKYYINIRRKVSFICPKCHKNTLVPDEEMFTPQKE